VNAPWPDRILAVLLRIGLYFIAALAEDPPAAFALAVIALTAAVGVWLLPRTKRWVDRRLDAHRLRTETDADGATDADEPCDAPEDGVHLADVLDLRPPTGPPARHHDQHHAPPGRRRDPRHLASRLRHKNRTDTRT